MKYLCLGYLNVHAFDALSKEQQRAYLEPCFSQCEVMRATGKIRAEEGLDMSQVRSIRPRKGRPHVTDGPYAETKEHVASYFVVEAGSIDEAVEIASLHPAALFGEEYNFGLEVRPIRE